MNEKVDCTANFCQSFHRFPQNNERTRRVRTVDFWEYPASSRKHLEIMSTKKCNKYDLIVPADRKWQYFVGASACIYFGGMILVLIGRLLYVLVKKSQRRSSSVSDLQTAMPSTPQKKKKISDEEDASWYVALKEGAGALVSAQTLQGRILVSKIITTLPLFTVYMYFFKTWYCCLY